MYINFTSHMTTRAFAHEDARRRRLAAMTVADQIKIGDLVQVGRGRKVWRVASFWGTPEHPMADLTPMDGYSRSSALLARLTVVERAPEESQDG